MKAVSVCGGQNRIQSQLQPEAGREATDLGDVEVAAQCHDAAAVAGSGQRLRLIHSFGCASSHRRYRPRMSIASRQGGNEVTAMFPAELCGFADAEAEGWQT